MSSLPNLAANTSNNNVQQSRSPGRSEKDQLWRCLPLHCALLRGDQCDLELAARPLGPLYKAWDCKITRAGDTTLHVIVGAGKWFNDPTVGPSAYTSRNNDGHTPLCVAAMVGNMEAAKNLLQLNPGMGSLDDAVGPYPIIEAARYGHKEMVLLLIGDMERKLGGFPPTKQSTASHFLHLLVLAGFYDLELDVHIIRNGLHRTSRFETAIQAVRHVAATFGSSNIWLNGHSLGAAMAMLAGKTMAKTGVFLDAFLSNPPFLAAPIERIKHEKVKHGIN